MSRFDGLVKRLDEVEIYHSAGRVTQSRGLLIEAELPKAGIGSVCLILRADARDLNDHKGARLAEVVGFRNRRAMLMPFEQTMGMNSGNLVVLLEQTPTVGVGQALLGRVLDGNGKPLDDGPALGHLEEQRSIYQKPSDPLKRTMIADPLDLGVRAINGVLTCGKGQRVGIMAGSGVGKSVLLGMLARNTAADINVIALIGERGREVREFIERDLGPEGLKR